MKAALDAATVVNKDGLYGTREVSVPFVCCVMNGDVCVKL